MEPRSARRLARRLLQLGACAAGALLAVPGDGAQQAPATDRTAACAQLSGHRVEAARIGLPTAGATVSRSTVVAAGAPDNPNGEYCKLEGEIHSVTAGAPPIRFQLNLPARWNRKALQMGGSGYNGAVVAGTGQIDMAPYFPPLSQGYATFGSDSGHEKTRAEADFALHDEALLNFGWQHLKKTRDVAVQLLRRHYGAAPRRVYFAGASTGGREAFTAIQRHPLDYDGIVASAPSLNFSGVRLMGVKVGQAAYRTPGGFLPPPQRALLHRAALQACDALDGLEDGLVGHVAACRKRAPALLAALRCGAGNGNDRPCLTEAQAATVRLLHEGYRLPYALAHGVRGYEGYNLLAGSDFSGEKMGLGKAARLQRPLTPEDHGYLFAQGDDYMRWFVGRDPSFDTLGFDIDRPGPLQRRLVELSGIVGATDPDLRAFRQRGGKAIVMHGLADEVISPNQTVAYHEAQLRQHGRAGVDAFMRLYTVPGFQHGGGRFVPFWDALGALDRWVEAGEAPQALQAIDIAAATQGRTRPMCPHPSFPRYRGRGDPDDAASFVCALS